MHAALAAGVCTPAAVPSLYVYQEPVRPPCIRIEGVPDAMSSIRFAGRITTAPQVPDEEAELDEDAEVDDVDEAVDEDVELDELDEAVDEAEVEDELDCAPPVELDAPELLVAVLPLEAVVPTPPLPSRVGSRPTAQLDEAMTPATAAPTIPARCHVFMGSSH